MRTSAHTALKGWTTVVLAAAALTIAALAIPLRAEVIEQVLVKVNGDIFTKTDLEARQIAAIRQQMNSRVDADALKNDAELRKTLLAITPQILVDSIDELLLIQIGKEKGYRLSDEQFKSWLENLRKEQNLQDEQKFQAALRQEGMTIDDLRKNVERQFLRSRVQQDEIGSKLTITEEEARQYYLAHKDEFAEPATVTLREIFIQIPTTTQKGQTGVNVGDDDAAEKKAAAIRARIASGEDFAKLASELSDSPSKANGGLIGPLPLSDLSDTLRETVAAMKQGEVTQPSRIAQGFQILKLETLKPAAPQPFESVRDLVADRVYDARQDAELRKFFARIRSRAIIEWKNQDLKKLYEQGLAQRATASN
jgi:parvulin-like peptidyl-prolyl isomerase